MNLCDLRKILSNVHDRFRRMLRTCWQRPPSSTATLGACCCVWPRVSSRAGSASTGSCRRRPRSCVRRASRVEQSRLQLRSSLILCSNLRPRPPPRPPRTARRRSPLMLLLLPQQRLAGTQILCHHRAATRATPTRTTSSILPAALSSTGSIERIREPRASTRSTPIRSVSNTRFWFVFDS